MSNVRIRLHNGFFWLILDHPPLNILSIEMLDQLTTAMHDAIKHPPRLVVISGAGDRAFVQVSMFVIISMDAKRTCCGLCMITMQHLSNYVRTRFDSRPGERTCARWRL